MQLPSNTHPANSLPAKYLMVMGNSKGCRGILGKALNITKEACMSSMNIHTTISIPMQVLNTAASITSMHFKFSSNFSQKTSGL